MTQSRVWVLLIVPAFIISSFLLRLPSSSFLVRLWTFAKKKGTKQRVNKEEEEEEEKLRVSSFWYYRQHIPNEEQPATAGPDYIEPAPLICFFPPISFFFSSSPCYIHFLSYILVFIFLYIRISTFCFRAVSAYIRRAPGRKNFRSDLSSLSVSFIP